MPRTRLAGPSRSIEGKVALITGSASGIGRACARVFSDEGASVVIAGGAAFGVVCDVGDVSQRNALIDQTIEHFGRIDILVDNAGRVRGTLSLRPRR